MLYASKVLRNGCNCYQCGRHLEVGEKVVKEKSFNSSGMLCVLCIAKAWLQIDVAIAMLLKSVARKRKPVVR